MQPLLSPIAHYPPHIVGQVQQLIEQGKFISWFEQRYPTIHLYQTDKALFDYAVGIKNHFMQRSGPLSKVVFDKKIHVINNALGLHSYVAKVHGKKVVSKNEIRIAESFKRAPDPLLRMLVVHELAHFKEKEHNKAFYRLCCHMEPNYHQLEFDARLFMIYQSLAAR